MIVNSSLPQKTKNTSITGCESCVVCIFLMSTIVLFALPFHGKSQTPYTITSSDVTIVNGVITYSTLTNISGNNYHPEVILPEKLDGQLVKRIAVKAFQNKGLIRVALPAGLTHIEANAFSSNNILSVIWPPGLVSIGSSAFRDNSLSVVNLPATVMYIGDFAFQNNRISSLSLPDGLKTIEESVFNVNFLISVDLPADLTIIKASAFRDNRITNVNLPAGLISIGDKAFLANRLSHVDLPEGLMFIGVEAFKFNSDLAGFVLPKGYADSNPVKWHSDDGKVLDPGQVILPANFRNSFKAIVQD